MGWNSPYLYQVKKIKLMTLRYADTQSQIDYIEMGFS